MNIRYEQQSNGDWWRIVEDNSGRERARYYEAAEQIIRGKTQAKIVDYKGDIIPFTGARDGLDFVDGFAPIERAESSTIQDVLTRLQALEDKIDKIDEQTRRQV